MRILHINCNYIGTTLHQLMVENLDALGIENEVFVPTYDKNIAVIEVRDNVFVSECFKKKDRFVFDYKQSKIIKTIEEHYNVRSFDLIHAYTLFTDGNAARVLSAKYGIPYVVAVRNTDLNDFFRLMIHLRGRGIKTMLFARSIYFLSESYKLQIMDKYVSKDIAKKIVDKIKIIPNGIDDFWLMNKSRIEKHMDKSCCNLVYAGGIEKNKNITATQKAMAILRERGINTHLTVVGKIKEQSEYKKVVDNEDTTYIQAQPKENLIGIYRNSDIFVMPSIHESFGLVYAEAMSQGLPVIYTKNQGFDGQFGDGVVGYSVNATDPDSIAQAITNIINNYECISSNCKKLVRKFEWSDLVMIYHEDYKKIIGEGK